MAGKSKEFIIANQLPAHNANVTYDFDGQSVGAEIAYC